MAEQPLTSARSGSTRSGRPPTHSYLRSRSASRGRHGLTSATSEDDITPTNGNRIGSHPPSAVHAPRIPVSPLTQTLATHQQSSLPPAPIFSSTSHSPMTTSVITSNRVPRTLPINSPVRVTQKPATPSSLNGLKSRSRIPTVSHSQPGSRSQSPSPRNAYITTGIPVNNSPGQMHANLNLRIGADENRARSASTMSEQEQNFSKDLNYRLGLAGLGMATAGRGTAGSCVAGVAGGDDNRSDAGSMCSDRSFGGMSRLSDRSAPATVGRLVCCYICYFNIQM